MTKLADRLRMQGGIHYDQIIPKLEELLLERSEGGVHVMCLIPFDVVERTLDLKPDVLRVFFAELKRRDNIEVKQRDDGWEFFWGER